jgi:hypothetical protein
MPTRNAPERLDLAADVLEAVPVVPKTVEQGEGALVRTAIKRSKVLPWLPAG